MHLLFIDESTLEIAGSGDRLVALTGVLVSATHYDAARALFYRSFARRENWGGRELTTRDGKRYVVADGMHVNVPPPELHGVKLLPERTDDEKIAALESAVQIVRDTGLAVYRVCLRLDATARHALSSDVERYFMCWSLMQDILTPVLERESVVPVWDAGNAGIEDRVPAHMRRRDHFRAFQPTSLLPDPSENLLGEVFFADSKHSAFIQVADLLSYVLMARDKLVTGWSPSDWIRRVAGVADGLPHDALAELRGTLRIQGTVHAIEPF